MEFPNPASTTQDFFELFRFQHSILKSESPDDHGVVVLYFSPVGGTIHVEYIFYDRGKDMLIIQGEDDAGHLCQTIAQAPGVHLMMKLIGPDSEAIGRKPVGFRVVENTGQGER